MRHHLNVTIAHIKKEFAYIAFVQARKYHTATQYLELYQKWISLKR